MVSVLGVGALRAGGWLCGWPLVPACLRSCVLGLAPLVLAVVVAESHSKSAAYS